jgi:hypothetical protein
MALSLSKKIVFGVSLGLIPSAPFLVLAGFWWQVQMASFGCYQVFLYLLAFLLAIVGVQNVTTLWREPRKGKDRNPAPP